MKLSKILQFSFLLSHFSTQTWGAACCGSGFSVPSIITTDDRAQFSISSSYNKVHSDVFTNQSWKKRTNKDIQQIYKIEAAHIFFDHWQSGISIPYQTRDSEGPFSKHSEGFGDISFQLAYEYLPEWDYNPYKPKGLGYLMLTTPTGKSIYESKDGSGIDARGRGLWGVGIGSILTKKWNLVDAHLNFEYHHLFEKHIKNDRTDGQLKPGFGGSISCGFGYSWDKLRLGTVLQWSYEDKSIVTGSTPSVGALKRVNTTQIILSYMLPHNSSLSINYGDQTKLDSPYNTSLNRSITLFYQTRWLR